MYFVQYNPLKQKLSSRSLSDGEALPYLILEGVVTVLLYLDISSEGLNAFDLVSVIISVAILIGGTFHVYDQNGGKEGFDLVQKYIVLGWVVGFRVFLASVPVIIILGVIVRVLVLLANIDDAVSDMVSVICGVAVKLIYYQRLGEHIRDTTGIETDNGGQNILPQD